MPIITETRTWTLTPISNKQEKKKNLWSTHNLRAFLLDEWEVCGCATNFPCPLVLRPYHTLNFGLKLYGGQLLDYCWTLGMVDERSSAMASLLPPRWSPSTTFQMLICRPFNAGLASITTKTKVVGVATPWVATSATCTVGLKVVSSSPTSQGLCGHLWRKKTLQTQE